MNGSFLAKFFDVDSPLFALTLIVGGVLALLYVFMMLDCLIRDFEHHGRITRKPKLDKFLWFVIVLTGIGAVVYYLKVRRKAPHSM
jgi:hypothetical protein